MTDYLDNCAHNTAEQTEIATHDLSHSSEPTGVAPTFQPVATEPAKTADEALEILAQECNELAEREQAMHAARGAYDTRSPEFEAAGKAIDPVADSLHMKWTMAALVRPDTHIGLAAKARIYHSMRFAREACVVPEAQPLLESITEDVARLGGDRPHDLWANEDAELIRTANEAIRLSAENDAVWGAGPELPDDDPREIAWHKKAKKASARYHACIEKLAEMRPLTPEGMAAKASVAPHLSCFKDEMRETPEADLMLSITKDALRIGAALPAPRGDAELLSLGRHFEAQWHRERIVIARNGSDEAIRIETDRSEDFVNRIRDLPATTPAGWHVKARAILWTCSGDVSGECPADMKVVASLLHDLGAIERGNPKAPTLPDPDQLVLKYHAPFYAAWKAKLAALEVYKTSDNPEATEAFNRAYDAVDEITRKLECFPAMSLDGLKLKAAALSALYPGDDITSEDITGSSEDATADIRLIVQIIRDLREMVDEPVVTVSPQPSSAADHLEQAA